MTMNGFFFPLHLFFALLDTIAALDPYVQFRRHSSAFPLSLVIALFHSLICIAIASDIVFNVTIYPLVAHS